MALVLGPVVEDGGVDSENMEIVGPDSALTSRIVLRNVSDSDIGDHRPDIPVKLGSCLDLSEFVVVAGENAVVVVVGRVAFPFSFPGAFRLAFASGHRK